MYSLKSEYQEIVKKNMPALKKNMLALMPEQALILPEQALILPELALILPELALILPEHMRCSPLLQFYSREIHGREIPYQKTAAGKPSVKVLKEGGVPAGMFEKGTVELAGTNGKTKTQGLVGYAPCYQKYGEIAAQSDCRAVLNIGTNGETTTQGLDGVAQCSQKYHETAVTKCSALLNIGPTEPSRLAINENANGLARDAAIRQENGLVPEILVEGIVLKPNMFTPGSESKKVALLNHKVRALRHPMPLVFLSGGQSEEEATVNLNAMNKLQTKKSWTVSCSISLQQSELKAWGGKPGTAAFLTRAKASLEATVGIYQGNATLGEGASDSLDVNDYKYGGNLFY